MNQPGVPVSDEEVRDNAGDAMNEAIQTTPGNKRVPEMDSNTGGEADSGPISTISPDGPAMKWESQVAKSMGGAEGAATPSEDGA